VIEAGGSVEHVMTETRLAEDLVAARLRFVPVVAVEDIVWDKGPWRPPTRARIQETEEGCQCQCDSSVETEAPTDTGRIG
jgi:hypothetical protein